MICLLNLVKSLEEVIGKETFGSAFYQLFSLERGSCKTHRFGLFCLKCINDYFALFISRSRKENLQLSSEYNKLQESYKQLEELKDQLQNKESVWMSNLTDSQKQNESSMQEVRLASDSDSVFYRQQVLKDADGEQPLLVERLKCMLNS